MLLETRCHILHLQKVIFWLCTETEVTITTAIERAGKNWLLDLKKIDFPFLKFKDKDDIRKIWYDDEMKYVSPVTTGQYLFIWNLIPDVITTYFYGSKNSSCWKNWRHFRHSLKKWGILKKMPQKSDFWPIFKISVCSKISIFSKSVKN